MPTFSFKLKREHLPAMGHVEQQQRCEVFYEIKEINHVPVISLTDVKFSIQQLNYLHYTPLLNEQMREAAYAHMYRAPNESVVYS